MAKKPTYNCLSVNSFMNCSTKFFCKQVILSYTSIQSPMFETFLLHQQCISIEVIHFMDYKIMISLLL